MTVVMLHLQFIDKVLDITVATQRQVRTVPNCAEERRDSTAQFVVWCSSARCYATTGAGVVQTMLLPWKCRSCSLPTVVDIPVVAQRCRSCSPSTAVDIPVVAQRQIPVDMHTARKPVDFPQVCFFAWLWTSADVRDEPRTPTRTTNNNNTPWQQYLAYFVSTGKDSFMKNKSLSTMSCSFRDHGHNFIY